MAHTPGFFGNNLDTTYLMMRRGAFFILTFVLSAFSYGRVSVSVTEKEMILAIKQDNISVLESFLSDGNNINGIYGGEKLTLLCYSIKNHSYKTFFKLIELGADPNVECNGKTPLIYCIQNRDLYLMRKVIKAGADLNAKNHKGNTALIYAAKMGKYDFVRSLIESGADAELTDKSGFTALDLANLNNYVEIATYLVKIIEMRHYYTNLPAYHDGPHIEWRNDTVIRMFYMIYDTIRKYPVVKEECFVTKSDTTCLQGFSYDTLNNYFLLREISYDSNIYKHVSKILSMGDIHGHFEAMVTYLKANKIVDDQLNWIWGDGHLIFQGDVVDRGNQVTECLWLIYKLDIQAQRVGGKVHLLLGNHEIMAMTDDTRYLNRKYEFFSNYFFTDYAYFFGINTVLGKYLRTRNTMVMINGMLYSHAGISPNVLDEQLSIQDINQILRNFIQNPLSTKREDLKTLITNANGPLWYRGYVFEVGDVELIKQEEVDSILLFYNAEKLIVAHTEVEVIMALYNNKVIAIDVPIRMQDCVPEGLLWQDKQFFVLHCDGSIHPFQVE